jgi:nucleoside-diphosphate-sugar epimerase
LSDRLFLVTGAGGFLGGHLVRMLAARGVRVRAMVRREAQVETLRGVAEHVVVADLRDEATLRRATEGVYGVYHVAAIFRQESVGPALFHDVNAEGVRRMLDAAIAAGAQRFVHGSTIGVHSHIDEPPADETAPFNPADTYQESKAQGELIAIRYFDEGRIRGVVIRPTMIYGPGDTRTLKMFRMIARRSFFYVGRGETLLHWVDVRDVANGLRLAMETEHVTAEAFLIGGRSHRTLKDTTREIARQLGVAEPWLHLPVGPVTALAAVTEAVCRPLGIEPPLYRRRVSFFLKDRAFDISKARDQLGYEPSQSFEQEIADIIADYRAAGLLPPGGPGARRKTGAPSVSAFVAR